MQRLGCFPPLQKNMLLTIGLWCWLTPKNWIIFGPFYIFIRLLSLYILSSKNYQYYALYFIWAGSSTPGARGGCPVCPIYRPALLLYHTCMDEVGDLTGMTWWESWVWTKIGCSSCVEIKEEGRLGWMASNLPDHVARQGSNEPGGEMIDYWSP
jgi:hypothetical protein